MPGLRCRGWADGCASPPRHELEASSRSATLRTQRGDNSVDKVGHLSLDRQDTDCGHPCGARWTSPGTVWTQRAAAVHDAGRPRGSLLVVHRPSPGSRRVLDSSPTGQSAPEQGGHPLSPDSTGAKTRNELRTPWMGSPPTSGPDDGRDDGPDDGPDQGQSLDATRTEDGRESTATATCRAVHCSPPPRVLSCGRSGRSRRGTRGGVVPTRRAVPSEVPRRT